MRKLYLLATIGVLTWVLIACSGKSTSSSNSANSTRSSTSSETEVEETGKRSPDYAITEVALSTPLDQSMITEGQTISEMKCTACHNLTEERLVGPGWKGITSRREPAWIMNMITNVDMMLAEDEEAQKMFEECLVRMPNQNIKVSEARSILEFMRQNDGVE